ncbi:MAG: SDR family oxidoreductase [Patescibacteria group bacterium]|nr:SDR family oxidoreductase [Patescibacteria group bacterium]
MSEPNKLFSVKDRVVIITGGAGILGRQYVEALSSAGAKVVVWDKAQGLDITDESAVKEAVAKIVKDFGQIDALVNNAAMNLAVDDPAQAQVSVPYEEYPIDLWDRELKVNLTGMMICIKSVSPTMITARRGSIVNVASELSVIAHDRRVYNDATGRRFKSIAYPTTKAGVLGLTRQWAARLGEHNVRVNALSPSGMHMPGQPADFVERYGATTMFGRMAELGEYNGVLLFLCSDASSYMTAHNLIVDGGRSAW